MRQMISSQSKQRSEQTSSAYSLILEMLKETEKVKFKSSSFIFVSDFSIKQTLAKMNKIIPIILIVFLSLVSCHEPTEEEVYAPDFSAEQPHMETTYIFGILPSGNPSMAHEIFSPMMNYLNENIDNVRFVVETSRIYAEFDEKVAARKFHFTLSNSYQTTMGIDNGYHVFAKMAGDEDFRGIIVVRKDSDIKNVSDLKGHTLSFPAPTALAGAMMPLFYLQTHGLDVKEDVTIKFVGSQESSILNVYIGNVKAGGTWPMAWRAFTKERPELLDELKVIWRTENLPNAGLLARNDVPSDIVEQVRTLMLKMHLFPEGRQWLKPLALSQWESAEDKTYDPVRDFIKMYRDVVISSDSLWEDSNEQ